MQKRPIALLLAICCSLLGTCVRDQEYVTPDQSTEMLNSGVAASHNELDSGVAPQYHDADTDITVALKQQVELSTSEEPSVMTPSGPRLGVRSAPHRFGFRALDARFFSRFNRNLNMAIGVHEEPSVRVAPSAQNVLHNMPARNQSRLDKTLLLIRRTCWFYQRFWYKYHTELLPKDDRPPVQRGREQILDPCNMFLCDQDNPSIGVGRDHGPLYWIIATMVPLISVLSIIIGVSRGARQACGFLDVRSKSATAAMVGAMLFHFCTSYTLYLIASECTCLLPSYTNAGLISLAFLLANVCQIASFRFAGVEFAWPNFSMNPFLQWLSILRMVFFHLLDDTCKFVAITLLVLFASADGFKFKLLSSWFVFGIVLFFDLPMALFSAFQPPSIASFVWLCLYFRDYVYHFYYFGDMTGSCFIMNQTYFFPSRYAILVYMALNCFVNNSRDRYFVAATGYLSRTCSLLAYFSSHLHRNDRELANAMAVTLVFSVAAIAPVCCILMRYNRILPAVLRDAKYIRISHFFKMQRQGQLITRCQDVPGTAFGNVAKAREVVIISHRWLDRYTCDVVTHSFPEGLRLTTMCQRFDRFWPSSFNAFLNLLLSNPLSAVLAAAESNRYSDHDVLIFFDFMSLPQIGKLPDGTLIERTAEEHSLFYSVLPAMGSLYTMYDVLICPDVTDTAVPYFSSGWCFCEWSQATISGKLSQYPLTKEESDGIGNDDVVDAEVMAWTSALSSCPIQFMRKFEIELQRKVFLNESDRDIVCSIARITQMRQMLLEAVCQQDACNVQDLLAQLSGHGLMESINDPVDDQSLDTLLHVAMRFSSNEIADALIQAGADVDSLNRRGDTPDELFMIKRAWVPCLRRFGI